MARFKHGRRQFDIPEDLRGVSFLDALVDAFTPPGRLRLYRPDCGWLARVRDAHRIRDYYRKALGDLGIELHEPPTEALDDMGIELHLPPTAARRDKRPKAQK